MNHSDKTGIQKKTDTSVVDEVQIRTPRFNDAPCFADYLNSIVKEAPEMALTKTLSKREAYLQLAERILLMQERKCVDQIVAEKGTNPARVYGYGKLTKKESPVQPHIATLSLSVHHKIRGRGVGTKLINQLISIGKDSMEIKIVRLAVYDTNPRARALYERLGFSIYGRLPDGVYHAGQFKDLIYMQKNIL